MSSKLKGNIAIVSGSYPPMRDGVGDYTERLARELSRELGGDRVSVITSAAALQGPGGCRVDACVTKWDLAGVLGVVRALASAKPCSVIIQYPTHGYGRLPAIALLPMLIRCRRPHSTVIAIVHEFINRTYPGKLRGLLFFLLCHRLITVVPSFEKAIGRWCPLLRGRFRHVPVGSNVQRHAVTAEKLSELRTHYGLTASTPVVCYFGVIRTGKGLGTLLDAFAQFSQSLPDARLLLLGHRSESFYETVLAPKADALGLAERIIHAGRCTEVELSSHFALASMCVLPYEEGFSPKRTTFMTAIEHGIPVITTLPQSPGSGLQHRHNVLLTPPEEAGELATQMLALASDASLRQTLQANSRELCNRYSWSGITKSILDVIEELDKPSSGG